MLFIATISVSWTGESEAAERFSLDSFHRVPEQVARHVRRVALLQRPDLGAEVEAGKDSEGGGDGMTREAERLLSRLGLSDPKMLERPVTELSVGQQQRVAVARALIGGPDGEGAWDPATLRLCSTTPAKVPGTS